MMISRYLSRSGRLFSKARRMPVQRQNHTEAASIQRIFSAIQPTGAMHLGNYLGAIKNWVSLQHECQGDVLYSIADLHCITVPQEPHILQQSISQMAITMIACGIDPSRSIIFKQSEVSHHTELAWILSCIAPIGLLSRMHQWKSKSEGTKESTCLGLYSYPVLMAADILLYRASHVPIGDDQLQHLELARELARIFNNTYGNFFTPPKPLLGKFTRVMSLRDATKKMSKSDPNPLSRIELTDTPDLIASKIRKSITDSENYISYYPRERPAVRNLIDIYTALSGETVDSVCEKYENVERFKAIFKQDLIDLVVEELSPIRKEMEKLENEKSIVDEVLKNGAKKAREIGFTNLNQVKNLVGFS